MNERIRELAEQAGLPVIDGEWDYNDREILCQVDGEWRVATPSEIISVLFDCEKGREKFAELIVKECVQTLIDNTPKRYTNESAEEDWDKGYDRAMKDCVHHIQEHFGVEE